MLPGHPSVDPAPKAPGERCATSFGPRDWAAVACAAGLALWWCVAVDGLVLSSLLVLAGGAAFTVAILGFFACALALLGRSARHTRGSVSMLAATAVLACVPAVTSDPYVRACNAFVLAAACMLEYLMLSGCADDVALRASGVPCALGFFLRSQFARFLHPLSALVRPGHGKASTYRAVLLSVLAALALLCVVLPLLMRADVIFDRVLGQVFARLGGDLETNLLRVARFVFVALVTSSLLVSLLRRDGACKTLPREGRAHVASVASVLPVLVMLDVVYLAFALVQCGYLFGGASASEVAGGYARYARSGFFELIAVAAINVCVLLATLWARRDAVRSRVVDASQLVLLALTLVVDASAAWRMGLYVGVYGFSELRAFALLGIVAVAVVVVLCAVRVVWPDRALYRWALGCLLALWCVFALSGVDAWVARFDVDGYLSGSIETIDVPYLASLSRDAWPALEHLAEEDPSMADEVDEQLGLSLACHGRDGGWAVRSLPSLVAGE